MADAIRLFVGGDKREAVGLHVFIESVLDQCSLPVKWTVITEAFSAAAGGQRDGSNSFAYGRFLCSAMSDWSDSLWMDGADMLCRGDLAELWDYARSRTWKIAAQVVKHDYTSAHAKKYLGTALEAENRSYPRKNWSSVIFWNGAHMTNRRLLTPDFVRGASGEYLHQFGWIPDAELGALPPEWNHLVGEQAPDPDAKLAHFTLGIPGFRAYANCEFAAEWRARLERVKSGLQEEPNEANLERRATA